MFIIFRLLSQSQYGILNDLYEILIFYYSLSFFQRKNIISFVLRYLYIFFFRILNTNAIINLLFSFSHERTIFKYCARHSKLINDSTYRLIPTNLLENLRLQSPKKLLFLFNHSTGKSREITNLKLLAYVMIPFNALLIATKRWNWEIRETFLPSGLLLVFLSVVGEHESWS